jgi:rhodanese-related sulfurtransferase
MALVRPLALEATTLRSWVLARQNPITDTSIPKKFQIVDVRDDDYIGGHIPGSLNIPSRQFGGRVPSLVHELKDCDAVVFTCALSQQRGPNVLPTQR